MKRKLAESNLTKIVKLTREREMAIADAKESAKAKKLLRKEIENANKLLEKQKQK